MTLQRAWDNNDLPRIQEYVTPELYNLLREERAQQPANNRTEIVRLFAELGSVQEIGKQAEATVLFHGVLDENGEVVAVETAEDAPLTGNDEKSAEE